MANIDLVEKTGRGGAREGAGRPAGKNYKCITLTLSEEAVIRLNEMAKEKCMTISQFITDHFNLPYYKDLPSKKGIKNQKNNPNKNPKYGLNFSEMLAAEENKKSSGK